MSLEHDLYVNKSSIPLSNYAKKLEPKVKKLYEEKISDIGVDPMLIEGKYFQRTFQFKAFRSLEAYNQMVCGFNTGI
jgi:hypothetical protein